MFYKHSGNDLTDFLKAYVDAEFSNWGQNVINKPQYTIVPKTKYGVQQIVQYAVKNGYGVRVSGYRKSNDMETDETDTISKKSINGSLQVIRGRPHLHGQKIAYSFPRSICIRQLQFRILHHWLQFPSFSLSLHQLS